MDTLWTGVEKLNKAQGVREVRKGHRHHTQTHGERTSGGMA